MTVYLIGPSGGYFDGNRKGFESVAAALRGQGLGVIDPREVLDCFDDPRAVYRSLLDAEAVVLMDGWHTEHQPRLLVAVAEDLSMPILKYPSLQPEKLRHLSQIGSTVDDQNTRDQTIIP